jgi:cell wall-associated NlpC family hydrolase
MSRLGVFAAAAGGLLLVPLLGVCLIGGGASSAAETGAALCVTSGPLPGLNTEQASNARLIAAVTQQQLAARDPAHVHRATLIALITAYQESGLRDLANPHVPGSRVAPGASGTGSDHDSVGLFQQRASWGTVTQRMDPAWATTTFLNYLLAVPGWSALPPGVAAQAVQVSARPDAYSTWIAAATGWVRAIDAGAWRCGAATIHGAVSLPAGFTLPPGTSPQAATAVTFALAQLGKPYVYGAAGPNAYDCSGFTAAAWAAAGITLPHYTVTQAQLGTPVAAPALLRPGDLVFTPGDDGTMQAPGHVGLYLDDNLIIEAPHTGDVIKIVEMRSFGPIAAMRHLG